MDPWALHFSHTFRTRCSPALHFRRRKEEPLLFHTSASGIEQPSALQADTALSARLLVSWLVFWILALPLMHVHIQAERHQGLPHNVLAGDLPGEFVSSADSAIEAAQPAGVPPPPHLASGISYPELAFTAPVPSKHHWLFSLTAIFTRDIPAEMFPTGRTVTPDQRSFDHPTPLPLSSPRAPPPVDRLT